MSYQLDAQDIDRLAYRITKMVVGMPRIEPHPELVARVREVLSEYRLMRL